MQEAHALAMTGKSSGSRTSGVSCGAAHGCKVACLQKQRSLGRTNPMAEQVGWSGVVVGFRQGAACHVSKGVLPSDKANVLFLLLAPPLWVRLDRSQPAAPVFLSIQSPNPDTHTLFTGRGRRHGPPTSQCPGSGRFSGTHSKAAFSPGSVAMWCPCTRPAGLRVLRAQVAVCGRV
eukprot:scaffold41664_cov17-Tisochrysis_lutea.AAC.1